MVIQVLHLNIHKALSDIEKPLSVLHVFVLYLCVKYIYRNTFRNRSRYL